MNASKLLSVTLCAWLLAGCCCPRPQAICATPAAPDPVSAEVTASQPAPGSLPKRSNELAMRDVLAKKRVRGMRLEEASLSAAVEYLETITGLRFHISPKVMEEKHEDIVINLHVDDVSMLDLLGVLTEPFGLRWEARGDGVWILTTEEIDGPLRLRYYDIKDLTHGNLEGGYGSLGEAIEDVRREVFPSYWDLERVSLEGKSGVLMVRASPGVHEAIERHLSAERSRLRKPRLPDALRKKFVATKVSLSITDQPLGEVIKILSLQTGFNLMIDPRSVSEVQDRPVKALAVENMPLTNVLEILGRYAGPPYVWVGKGNVAVLMHRDHAP